LTKYKDTDINQTLSERNKVLAKAQSPQRNKSACISLRPWREKKRDFVSRKGAEIAKKKNYKKSACISLRPWRLCEKQKSVFYKNSKIEILGFT